MAVNYFTANPDVAAAYQENSYGLSPQEFADAHYSLYGAEEARAAPVVLDLVSQGNLNPTQIAAATGIPVNQVIAQVATTVPQGQATLIGDTWVQPNYQIIGSGMDQQVGGIENISVYKSSGDVNSQIPEGTTIQNYTPTGELAGTSVSGPSSGPSFFGGLLEALTDPVVLAALAGGYGAGLFGGAASGLGAGSSLGTGLTAGAGGLGLSTTGAGLGALGTGAGITAGAGLTGTGILTGSALGAGLLGTSAGSLTGTGILSGSTLGTELLGTGAGTGVTGGVTGLGTGTLGTGALTTGVPSVVPPVVPTIVPPVVPPVAPPVTPTVPPVAPPVTPSGLPVVPPVSPTSVIPPAISSLIPTAISSLLTPTNIGNLATSGATTAAGLLQQQTSREAAIAAQAMIDRETTAAKTAAAFKPIGMTTRFGTSQFVVDPKTGQLTSAGYTLSPEAKAQQDRFVALSNAGLTQAEAAQQQFAPLQTGATSLFALGNKYLAETPEKVAENYLKSQMALLQPGRELELATLQNRLQQQGRGGLSVAQGGTLGATTPELQALYNARAQQEAQLAAQAQQAGQQQVLYGAGLLGQGTTAMGNYYAGQQAAYTPYTTAMGQVQGLEALGQQPLNMSTALAQQTSQAGANVGRLGLSGAEFSTRLATSPAATTNPYSTLLGGVGSSNQFGQFVGGLLGGTPATSGFSYGQYGTGVDPSTGEYFGSLYF